MVSSQITFEKPNLFLFGKAGGDVLEGFGRLTKVEVARRRGGSVLPGSGKKALIQDVFRFPCVQLLCRSFEHGTRKLDGAIPNSRASR